MINLKVCLAVCASLFACNQARLFARVPSTKPAVVPRGSHVLLDGHFGDREWTDALEIAASEEIRFYIKRDATYMYVAVRPATANAFGTDLYLDFGEAGQVWNLHASAKLGERAGRIDALPEWSWWNNRQWAANVVRVAEFEPRKFLADEVKEFQISIARLKGKRVWLSVDLYAGERTQSVPIKGDVRYERRWVELRL